MITSSAGRDSEKRREAAEVGEHDRAVERPAAEARAVGLREHLLDDGLGDEAREEVADVPLLGVGLLARAGDGLERERDLVGERLERGAVLARDAVRRLDLELAAALAHHDEREARRARRRPSRAPAEATASPSSVSVARAVAPPANATAVSTAARWISSSVVAATSVAAAARSCDSRSSARSWLATIPASRAPTSTTSTAVQATPSPLRLEGEHRRRRERRRGEEREPQRRQLRRRLGRGLAESRRIDGCSAAAPKRR